MYVPTWICHEMQSDVNRPCPVMNVMLMGLVWTIDGLVAQETDTFGVGNDLGFCRTPILCVKKSSYLSGMSGHRSCHSLPMSATNSLTHDLVETSMIWPLLKRIPNQTLMLTLEVLQNMWNMQNLENMHKMQNMPITQNTQNMQNMQNKQNLQKCVKPNLLKFNLPNQTYQTKPIKPNQIKQNQTQPSNQNLPKTSLPNKMTRISLYWFRLQI